MQRSDRASVSKAEQDHLLITLSSEIRWHVAYGSLATNVTNPFEYKAVDGESD